MTRRSLAVAAAAVVAMVPLGCDSDDKKRRPVLRAAPELVQPGSPGELVARYWRHVARRDSPFATALYDRRVRAKVGLRTLAGALGRAQTILTSSRARLLSAAARGRRGTALIRARERGKRRVRRYSFTLLRRGGRWQLVTDDLTGRAIREYVAARLQERIDPFVRTGERAKRAGREAYEHFRATGAGVLAGAD